MTTSRADRPAGPRRPRDRARPAARERLGRLAVLGGATVWLCRLGPSDRWVATALFAYVPPAVTLLAAAFGLWAAGRERSAWRVAALLLAAASLAQVVADNPRLLAATPPPAGGIAVLQWNVARNPRVVPALRELAADAQVVALNEAERLPGAVLGEAWHEWGEGDLRLAARAPIERRRLIEVRWGRALHAVVRTDPPLSIVLADVAANPDVPRRDVLRALAGALARLDPVPDLIVGDLNTPAHAASLESLLALGYAPPDPAADAGPAYTWPSPLPVMRIDHVLARSGVAVVRHTSGASWRSDHRWQRVVVRPAARR